MKTRTIKDLCQLPDRELFEEISKGYERILRHALLLNDDAKHLAAQKHITSNRALFTISTEEAAKCLILLDAVRCPKSPQKLSAHLKKFYDHLAKALYDYACHIEAPNFRYLIEYINFERNSKYSVEGRDNSEIVVEGNRLLFEREEVFYIDYIQLDNGKHAWLTPPTGDLYAEHTPITLELANAFYKIGATTPKALKSMAEYWRSVQITEDLTNDDRQNLNWEMLKLLDQKQLLQNPEKYDLQIITRQWALPMYAVEMSIMRDS